MLNAYCWRCGSEIIKEHILGLGYFNEKIGKYQGKGFVAFKCPKCNKVRYQILEKNKMYQEKLVNKANSSPQKKITDFNESIDLNQVIDFYKVLRDIETVDLFLKNCQLGFEHVSNDQFKRIIVQPLDVYNLFLEVNSNNMKRLMIIILDENNCLLNWEFMGEGVNKPVSFNPKDIFRTPLLMDQLVSVIIAHNLNDNFSQASQKEIEMTKRLQKAAKILGVKLQDFVIIDKNDYYSYDQLNLI